MKATARYYKENPDAYAKKKAYDTKLQHKVKRLTAKRSTTKQTQQKKRNLWQW